MPVSLKQETYRPKPDAMDLMESVLEGLQYSGRVLHGSDGALPSRPMRGVFSYGAEGTMRHCLRDPPIWGVSMVGGREKGPLRARVGKLARDFGDFLNEMAYGARE